MTPSPNILLFRRVTRRFPARPLWEEIEAAMTPTPDEPFFERCFLEWSKRGYRPLNLAWLFEWYQSGRIPVGAPQATTRKGITVGASPRPASHEILNSRLTCAEIIAFAEADEASRPQTERQSIDNEDMTLDAVMEIVRNHEKAL